MLNRARIARYTCFFPDYTLGCTGFLSFSTFTCTAIQRQHPGRKCFVITAAPRRRQNYGTRCVFGVPPALPNPSAQAPPDTLPRLYSCFTLNRPPPHDISAVLGGLLNVSRPHSKLCTRSSFLGVQNFPLNTVVMVSLRTN